MAISDYQIGQEIYTETKLESYILNHLQSFLLEMGRGFCFEARQKRILIDQDYFKADLIFYHRILKCHVIIDLKIDRFRHEYASQLNLYMNYYKHEVMQVADMLAERLGIANKWKFFEKLWHRNNMRSDYNTALDQRKSLEFQERLKHILG